MVEVKSATATALLAALALCSCAASMAKGPFIVPIDSSPRGAVVTQSGRGIGVTPCSARVSGETPVLLLELEGYAPREVNLGTISNGQYVFLGILLWGPVELLVTAGHNAWRRIDDRPVFVELAMEPLPRWERPVEVKEKRIDLFDMPGR